MTGRYGELIAYRVWAELRSETARSYLGILWWVLEPLLFMAVFYVVFGIGLRQAGEDFVAFLLCGLIPWKWLDSAVRGSSTSILGSVGLMQQVYLPKWILPLTVIGINTVKFFIVLAVLLLFLACYGVVSFWTWIYLPLVLLSQLVMILAFSLLAAALVPLLPDLRYVINNGMLLLFFLSGIFFRIDQLTLDVQWLLYYNPVLILLESYRSLLLYGTNPDWLPLLTVNVLMLILLGFSVLMLSRFDRFYPRVVG